MSVKEQILRAKGKLQELKEELRRTDIEAKGNVTLIKSSFAGFESYYEIDLEMAEEQMHRLRELKFRRIELAEKIQTIQKEFGIE